MSRSFLYCGLALALGFVLFPARATAQQSPTTKRAPYVRITKGPELERNDSYLTIIRWTTTNPGGNPVHYGVVYYGTSPGRLGRTAKSPIRLNPYHAYTVFRVRIGNLRPRTTYYYAVGSTDEKGGSDGVKSPVGRFTTP